MKPYLIIVCLSVVIAAGASFAEQVSFQQGVDRYDGTQDTHIHASVPQGYHGEELFLRFGSNKQVLIRFDDITGTGEGRVGGPRSQGRYIKINSARLTFVAGEFLSGFDLHLHRLLVNWSESSTWQDLEQGIALDDTEAVAEPDGSQESTSVTGGEAFSLDVTASVQAWVDGEPNHGWVIPGRDNIHNDENNALAASSEHQTTAHRPRLEIDFTVTTKPVTERRR